MNCIKKFSTIFLFLLSCCSCAGVFAQQLTVNGYVYEKDSTTVVPFAYVINKRNSTGVLADINGRYSITALQTDTLIISYTGKSTVKKGLLFYKDKVKDNELNLNIYLSAKVVELKEFVVRSFDFSKEEKQRFEKYIEQKHYEYSLQSPITALYYQFSKEGRQLMKLKELYSNMPLEDMARNKLSNELLQRITGNPEMTYDLFQKFCHFSEGYILSTPDYDLYLAIKRCYQEYSTGY